MSKPNLDLADGHGCFWIIIAFIAYLTFAATLKSCTEVYRINHERTEQQ